MFIYIVRMPSERKTVYMYSEEAERKIPENQYNNHYDIVFITKNCQRQRKICDQKKQYEKKTKIN